MTVLCCLLILFCCRPPSIKIVIVDRPGPLKLASSRRRLLSTSCLKLYTSSVPSILCGGAYNTPSLGMRCDADFAVGDDTFFFPNVGFRCCR